MWQDGRPHPPPPGEQHLPDGLRTPGAEPPPEAAQVWNALEVDRIIHDPTSGYGIESGLLFGRWSVVVCMLHHDPRYERLPC